MEANELAIIDTASYTVKDQWLFTCKVISLALWCMRTSHKGHCSTCAMAQTWGAKTPLLFPFSQHKFALNAIFIYLDDSLIFETDHENWEGWWKNNEWQKTCTYCTPNGVGNEICAVSLPNDKFLATLDPSSRRLHHATTKRHWYEYLKSSTVISPSQLYPHLIMESEGKKVIEESNVILLWDKWITATAYEERKLFFIMVSGQGVLGVDTEWLDRYDYSKTHHYRMPCSLVSHCASFCQRLWLIGQFLLRGSPEWLQGQHEVII